MDKESAGIESGWCVRKRETTEKLEGHNIIKDDLKAWNLTEADTALRAKWRADLRTAVKRHTRAWTHAYWIVSK